MQRYWAHLLREVDNGVDLLKYEQMFSTEVHRRFDALKASIGKDPPKNQRNKQKLCWERDLAYLADKYIEYPEVRTKVQYLKHRLGSWHICLLHPGMQPTNNLAE